ncbi:augurin [Panthera uncia]|uniref:augurin n=1 Tax=Panthera uncia TaxID=29064 RepID=UPI0020FF9F10|nr:augurin [Panthera uncia]
MAASSARLTVLAMTALALLLLLCLGPEQVWKTKLLLASTQLWIPKKSHYGEKAEGRCGLGGVGVLQSVLCCALFLQKFEDDITYWLNRGRNGYDYDSYQRHYDEDSAMSPYD